MPSLVILHHPYAHIHNLANPNNLIFANPNLPNLRSQLHTLQLLHSLTKVTPLQSHMSITLLVYQNNLTYLLNPALAMTTNCSLPPSPHRHLLSHLLTHISALLPTNPQHHPLPIIHIATTNDVQRDTVHLVHFAFLYNWITLLLNVTVKRDTNSQLPTNGISQRQHLRLNPYLLNSSSPAGVHY